MNIRLRYFILIAIPLLIAACGGDAQQSDLPTLAALPPVTATRPEVATLPPTWTPSPTVTDTITPSATLTSTVTPSKTITNTPTLTFTPSPFNTEGPRAITGLIDLALQTTLLPTDFVVPQRDGIEVTLPADGQITPLVISDSNGVATVAPDINCPYFPAGGFGTLFTSDGLLANQLGCPEGSPPATVSVSAASQLFERGMMLWLEGSPSQIYVMDNNNGVQVFADTYNATTDPISGNETPPTGFQEPVRGFGKVWRSFNTVRGNLGWARADETGTQATVQRFENGLMVWIPGRGDIFVIVQDTAGGTWSARVGQF